MSAFSFCLSGRDCAGLVFCLFVFSFILLTWYTGLIKFHIQTKPAFLGYPTWSWYHGPFLHVCLIQFARILKISVSIFIRNIGPCFHSLDVWLCSQDNTGFME